MRPAASIRNLISDEDGGFTNNAIFFGVIIIIVAIIVIDGSSVFYANQAATNISQEAANLAADTYRETHSDISAENTAADHCEAKGLDFLKFNVNQPQGHSFNVTCGKDARTYVFKHLPYLDRLIHQEDTSISAIY